MLPTRFSSRGPIITMAWLFLSLAAFGLLARDAQAQGEDEPGLDIMVLIDNSCSMFPTEIAVQHNCFNYGNDPSFLRIIGSDIFFASLGLSEPNEDNYQMGVISFDDTADLISDLQPIAPLRGQLAALIANPVPGPATAMGPALALALERLDQSSNRRVENPAAIVLLTDGIPFPREGQTDADIERLIEQNPDTSIFVMLLQNDAEAAPDDYTEYVRFWQRMQTNHNNVFAYFIQNPQQIEETYNKIVAQLQDTIPAEGFSLEPNQPVQVFVSKYVQRLVVKILHNTEGPRGVVTVTDPRGIPVTGNDPGVDHFDDPSNPVEVLSIGSERLDIDTDGDGVPNLKDDIWAIESDAPVFIFLDRRGAYTIRFQAPSIIGTQIPNIYHAVAPHSPDQELTIAFTLVDSNGNVIREPQPIRGRVLYPDQTEVDLLVPADLQPDQNGIYEITYLMGDTYKTSLDTRARFNFIIDAGSADPLGAPEVPITSARLQVEFGNEPYIDEAAEVACSPQVATEMTVTIGNFAQGQPDSMRLRLFAGDQEIFLDSGQAGTFSGDVSAVCAQLVSNLQCNDSTRATYKLRLSGQTTAAAAFRSERDVVFTAAAPPCTATPPATATPAPTPLPTPTPIPPPPPDMDGDTIPDATDRCETVPGSPQFDGCPRPLWHWALIGMAALLLLAFIFLWLLPWIKVRTFGKPPEGYVLVCRQGDKFAKSHSLKTVGLTHRTNVIRIGSKAGWLGGRLGRDHIYDKDLKPSEFEAIVVSGETKIEATESNRTVATLRKIESSVNTSAPHIKLKVGTESDIRC